MRKSVYGGEIAGRLPPAPESWNQQLAEENIYHDNITAGLSNQLFFSFFFLFVWHTLELLVRGGVFSPEALSDHHKY